jgi:hypothetical protein
MNTRTMLPTVPIVTKRGTKHGLVLGIVLLASCMALLGSSATADVQVRSLLSWDRTKSGGDLRSPLQSLRTCADRWNQGNMRGWGPALIDVSLRRLDSAHLRAAGLDGKPKLRCVILFSFEFRRDNHKGCSGGAVVPGDHSRCFDPSGSFFCVINRFGAYACPPRHEPDRTLPLRRKDGATDARGVLTLSIATPATHRTPLLLWQKRYPHIDGWILPWTSSGDLRRGVTLNNVIDRGGGTCGSGSEQSVALSALRCLWHQTYILDPCFPQHARWNHRGAIVACATEPGSTMFGRLVVNSHS